MARSNDRHQDKLRLLYIPTNRDCSQILPQVLKEAAWAAHQPGNSIIFCLIENSLDPSISEKHAQLLKDAPSRVNIVHFRETQQAEFVEVLLAHQAMKSRSHKRLQQLLLPGGISYGRGPNLAYLFAESLGAVSVHRRDSDVSVEYTKRLPIEMELAAINRPLDQVRPSVRDVNTQRYTKSAQVKIVGTGVYGDATFDRRDLGAAGLTFLTAFQSLGRPCVVTKAVEQEATEYLLAEPKRRYLDDFYELDMTGKVEMGAVCISDTYRYLPEMPTDILGCDYMVNDLNWHLHNPALFHSRKVRHTYDDNRTEHKDLSAAISYVLRDVQYIQVGRIWSQVGERLEQDKIYKQPKFDTRHYATVWKEISSASPATLRDVRIGAQQVYAEAAQAATGPLSLRLQAAENALRKTGKELDRQVMQAIDDYVYLVKAWPNLMVAARKSKFAISDNGESTLS